MSVTDNLEKLTALLVETNLGEGDDIAKMGVEDDKIKEAAPEFKAVLAALKSEETSPEIKAKCLQCVANNGAYFENHVKDCFKDCMKVVVDILGTTDEQIVELAAVEAISGLGMKATALESKKAEFVTREAVDLILQVSMDKERKDVVSKAAKNQFTKMVTKSDFKAVATKLVHWLSDDREDDDAEHLAAEREFALTQLGHLSKPAFGELWKDDVFQHVFKFLTIVMPTVTITEYTRLMSILPNLPQVKASNSTNLVDLVLGAKYVKADADRVVEMLVILGNSIPKTTRHEALVKKLQPEISKITSDDSTKNTLLAKAALVAARAAADGEESEKLTADVAGALKAATDNFNTTSLPANLTAVDTLIVALHVLGRKSILPVIDFLGQENVKTYMSNLSETLAGKEKLVVFAVKKKMTEKKATDADKLLLGTVRNLVASGKMSAAGELLSTKAGAEVCAWEKKLSFPQVKKSVGGPQQQQQQQGNGNSNGRNNSNSGNNNKYKAGPQKRNRH